MLTDNSPSDNIPKHGNDMHKPHKYDYEVKLDSQMAPAKVIRQYTDGTGWVRMP